MSCKTIRMSAAGVFGRRPGRRHGDTAARAIVDEQPAGQETLFGSPGVRGEHFYAGLCTVNKLRLYLPRERSGGSGKPAKRGWSEGEQRQKGFVLG
jgi:hypothetical protein